MLDEAWSLIVRKATVYDLLRRIAENPHQAYTIKELEKLFDAYITGVEQ